MIDSGCDALIPFHPPKEAIEARRRRANQAARGAETKDVYYHTPANPAKGELLGERGLQSHGQKKGYRPGRKSQQRQQGRRKKRGE